MSSTIFYRFKSQKTPSRILFDGTGLTVLDLKREIILNNKLGDGSDFQLKLYSLDTGDEIDEDQVVIPRSSSVVVKRSPAFKPNNGSILSGGGMNNNSGNNTVLNATRYVTGKPRVFAHTKKKQMPSIPSSNSSSSNNAVSEEERIANMFATQANEWERTQEEMSSATPVIHSNGNNSHRGGNDDGPPPAGYMCYRCGSRTHWIKNCPTNNDPNFEGKRIKRTTGIPKKFLQTIEVDTSNMSAEEMAQRKIMITDEGKFVVQVEDKQSWDEYQRRQEKRQLKGKEEDMKWASGYYKDLPKELKCPITGGILRDPVRTSGCCNKVFSKNALEDLLLNNDFICPSCGQEEVLLDSLESDKDMKEKVEEYMKEHTGGDDNVGMSDGPDAKKIKLDGVTSPVKDSTTTDNSTTDNNKKTAMPPPPMPFPMPFMPMFPFMPPLPGNNNNMNNNNMNNNNINKK